MRLFYPHDWTLEIDGLFFWLEHAEHMGTEWWKIRLYDSSDQGKYKYIYMQYIYVCVYYEYIYIYIYTYTYINICRVPLIFWWLILVVNIDTEFNVRYTTHSVKLGLSKVRYTHQLWKILVDHQAWHNARNKGYINHANNKNNNYKNT